MGRYAIWNTTAESVSVLDLQTLPQYTCSHCDLLVLLVTYVLSGAVTHPGLSFFFFNKRGDGVIARD